MATIPRTPPTGSLAEWNRDKPTMRKALGHVERVIRCAPPGWQAAIRTRLGNPGVPRLDDMQTDEGFLASPPEWAVAWDLMQAVAGHEDRFGAAALWALPDEDIRDMAKKLAAEAEELDALCIGRGDNLAARVDSMRMLVRFVGIAEDKPVAGLPGILRAQDAAWWRKRLRVHVARVVEAGAVGLCTVHVGTGGYISNDGLQRRQAQLKRNAEALRGSLYRNEAGQVFTLHELAALSTANPIVRGGELMTRIRGAEEYADARGHVGIFATMTLPSRFHPVKMGSGGRPIPNAKHADAVRAGLSVSPRDGQLWLRGAWARVRAEMAREGVRMYGLRVAEPHHDSTPHWHALLWAESEDEAQAIEDCIRDHWLRDAGDERGAQANRVNFKRMTKGGAAGYVAKYIAKSVGHLALAEHMDVVDGQQIALDFGASGAAPGKPGSGPTATDPQPDVAGYRRVDAWASHWGIRQFQAFGMPSVTVWRELRRVSKDQLELFQREGDRATVRAAQAVHRSGTLRADWRLFMECMGGHALKRGEWHLRIARRPVWAGQVNRYGEEVKAGRIVGLEPQHGRMCGRWLVSRRIAWAPVLSEASAAATAAPPAGAPAAPQAQGARPAAALPRPWTGFTNCTARLTGELRRAFLGRGRHEIEDWATPQAIEMAARAHAFRPAPAAHHAFQP
ncbi:replication protein A [Paracidovorax avenae]|uniref:replication endonuclease n=1 Tax=Paracidovorax avenae TaxID=80867 RepID=UPI000D224813|nr:replication endonuclease [Paracidovorax avenae]AVS66621.1 replication protein A [Paracidovorax avenae]